MAARKKLMDISADILGVSAQATVGRVAARGVSRTGVKAKGKYAHEALCGQEFNVAGDLMRKERIIDRENNIYRELVVNSDTGEIVRDVEQPLSEHTGRGSAKHKKQAT